MALFDQLGVCSKSKIGPYIRRLLCPEEKGEVWWLANGQVSVAANHPSHHRLPDHQSHTVLTRLVGVANANVLSPVKATACYRLKWWKYIR